jgi:hypothetical protein
MSKPKSNPQESPQESELVKDWRMLIESPNGQQNLLRLTKMIEQYKVEERGLEPYEIELLEELLQQYSNPSQSS